MGNTIPVCKYIFYLSVEIKYLFTLCQRGRRVLRKGELVMNLKSNIFTKIFITAVATAALLLCVLAVPTSVAGAALPVEKFAITGGINTNKTSEITFDTTRVISGTAEKGTQVAISVYEPVTTNGQTTNKLIRSYSLTVGSTGIFSQSVSLKEGQNYIVVAATNNGRYSEVKTTINRKNTVIKYMLSQSFAVPGQSNW